MSDIVIRFAVYDDVDRIMEAINDHWDASHILAHNRDFFLYFLGGNDHQLNMVIGEDQNTKKIAGFLGYIRYSENDSCDFSPILWKNVNKGDSFLGLKLMLFLVKNIKPRLFFCIGVNPNTALPIYKQLKYHVGQLEHYYRISDKDDYKIAKIVDKRILQIKESGWRIQLIPDFDAFKANINDFILDRMYPYKDENYFCHRFFIHPIYRYMFYAIKENDFETMSAFFVCREVEKFGVKILRIIDYIGDEKYFAYLAFSLQKLMNENNYEYIDCYCCGMSEATMNDAGFIKREKTDKNIIPNYFEPFLCENIEIYYFTNITENFRTFKGDADQDQPRINDRSMC
jgi:hypothetical protein